MAVGLVLRWAGIGRRSVSFVLLDRRLRSLDALPLHASEAQGVFFSSRANRYSLVCVESMELMNCRNKLYGFFSRMKEVGGECSLCLPVNGFTLEEVRS